MQQSKAGSYESETCQEMKNWRENYVFLQDRCITNRCITNAFKLKMGLSKLNV